MISSFNRSFDRSKRRFRMFFFGVTSLMILGIAFAMYNFSQREVITITIKDKYTKIETSGTKDNISTDTHYRVVDSASGEIFDLMPITMIPTAAERLYFSMNKGSTYKVEVAGIKSVYNVRSIITVK
jgi:hypothetical protein